MGLLNGYFTPEALYGAIKGDYKDLLNGKVNRPSPNHTDLDWVDATLGTAAEALGNGANFDAYKLIQLIKAVNPVANTKGIDPVKLLQLANVIFKAPEKLPRVIRTDTERGEEGMLGIVKKVKNLGTSLGLISGNSGETFYNSDEGALPLNAVSRKTLWGEDRSEHAGEFNTNDEEIDNNYVKIESPYSSNDIEVKSELDAVNKVSTELGINLGYGELGNFEIGSNHIWRIQLFPYSRNGIKLEASENTVKKYSNKLIPALPWYPISLDRVLPSEYLNGESKFYKNIPHYFHFGYHCPVIQYNLDLGSLRSKSVNLFNESHFNIPAGMAYEPTITFTVLDDVYGSFRMWYHKYLNNLYELKTASIPRFDDAALVVRLMIFKPNYQPKYEFRFICVPQNYSVELSGTNDTDEDHVTMNLSIIGMIKETNGDKYPTYAYQGFNSDATWTDITLLPRVLE